MKKDKLPLSFLVAGLILFGLSASGCAVSYKFGSPNSDENGAFHVFSDKGAPLSFAGKLGYSDEPSSTRLFLGLIASVASIHFWLKNEREKSDLLQCTADNLVNKTENDC